MAAAGSDRARQPPAVNQGPRPRAFRGRTASARRAARPGCDTARRSPWARKDSIGHREMRSQSHAIRGALWMGAAVLSFAVMAVSVRELLQHMNILEILALRTLVTLAIVCATIARHGVTPLRTPRFPIPAARALVHLGGQACWMYAIGALTLATVFAI